MLDACMQLFGKEPAIKYILNDNCNAIFKIFSTVASSTFVLNYFAYVIVRNLPKYAYELLSNNAMKDISDKL